jgi:hypothetical protein
MFLPGRQRLMWIQITHTTAGTAEQMENADIPVPICVCSMLHSTGGENSQNYRFLPHVVPVPVQHTGRTATGTGLAA